MSLLIERRFLPLFLTQFLGAFNDNLLKNALVILITFRIAPGAGDNGQLLVTMAAGLFILPFFLFSASAGQFADKYDRAKLTRIIKIVEIGIMALATAGFLMHSIWVLMIALFMMGMHSTFFGPIKYAILPQHLQEQELLPGNAYIESGTFLAILLGTILGGILILLPSGEYFVCGGLMIISVLGYGTSRSIPAASAPEPTLVVSYNIWRETWEIIAFSYSDKKVFLCILGISWFWLVGATFLSQFAPYVKDDLHADSTVVTLFLTIFSIGIGVGSFVCNRILKGEVKSTYVTPAGLGITLFGVDLYFASQHGVAGNFETLLSLRQFIENAASLRIMFDLMMIAVSAGVYIVPLYAIMQQRSEPAKRARIIAANNIINSLFMVVSAVGTLIMMSLSFTIPEVFLVISILNGFVAIISSKLTQH